ncbi:MAG: DUF4389 domain-containing protein [Dehalococcoidia bacterium]
MTSDDQPPGGAATLAASAAPPLPPRNDRYPMLFDVAYPGAVGRWKTAIRLILAIPIVVIAYPLAGLVQAAIGIGWITVVARRTYPGWLFEGLSGAAAFVARIESYLLLLTDRYPSFNAGDSPVTLVYAQPPDGRISRWRVFFWKLALLVPHLFALFFLGIAVAVVTMLAWFAILFTGKYPRGLFGFVTGVQRWRYRVAGYFASFNDRLPPFSLAAEAGPASNSTAIICAVLGLLMLGSFTGLAAAAAASANSRHTVEVQYSVLQAGEDRGSGWTVFDDPSGGRTFFVTLQSVDDPDETAADALQVDGGLQLVTFTLVYGNLTDGDRRVAVSSARLRFQTSSATRTTTAILAVADGIPAPVDVPEGVQATVRFTFAIPAGAEPSELLLDPPWSNIRGIRFLFR